MLRPRALDPASRRADATQMPASCLRQANRGPLPVVPLAGGVIPVVDAHREERDEQADHDRLRCPPGKLRHPHRPWRAGGIGLAPLNVLLLSPNVPLKTS